VETGMFRSPIAPAVQAPFGRCAGGLYLHMDVTCRLIHMALNAPARLCNHGSNRVYRFCRL
jgi:hypothetical protein